MNSIKLLELFGGIGACSKALEKAGIDYEIADYVEIDKYAVKSYNAIHGTAFEPQDITKWDKDIEVDMIMHGSPCQDFSIAGSNKGGDKGSGTRSSLMYESIRIIEKLKPKYVIWENVKNLLSQKHRHNFDAYLEAMNQLGYSNFYEVLNAKDYGIPQNRERVFTVSIRNDVGLRNIKDGTQMSIFDFIESKPYFSFPDKQPLELRLKDMLEDNVDGKFYLDDEQVGKLKIRNDDALVYDASMIGFETSPREYNEIMPSITARECRGPRLVNANRIMQIGNYANSSARENPNKAIRLGGVFDTETSKHQAGSVWDKDGLSPTLDTMGGGYRQPCVIVKEATSKGYAEAFDGDSVNFEQPNSKTRRGRVGKQVAQTLTTSCNQGVAISDHYLSEKGVKYILDSKRGMATDVNPNVAQPLTAKGQSNWTGSFISPDIDHIEKSTTLGSKEPTKVHLKNGETITQNDDISKLRIRKLTPKECWRLMGFDDEDFEKAEKVNSNTQLYKQAGNSIVVNVLVAILESLLK